MKPLKPMLLSLVALFVMHMSNGQTTEKTTTPAAKPTTKTTVTTTVTTKKTPPGKAKKPYKRLPSTASDRAREATGKTTVVKTEVVTPATPATPATTPAGTTAPSTSAPQSGKTEGQSSGTSTSTNQGGTLGTGKTGSGSGTGTGTGTTTQTGSTTQPSPGSTGKMGTGTGSQTTSGGVLNNVIGGNFSELDAASAIKEALMKGVTTGVNKVSVTDGYFKNSMIKIPFPQDAKVVETTLRQMGMGSMVDKLVLSLNRAAEKAATQAGPIFLNGIKQMTVNDAISIVNNQQPDAATQFLQRTTTEQLVSSFKPSIKSALDKTLATKYWSEIMTTYNKVPFVKKINPDLTDFVTRKAISGLFYMIGQEEAKIRKDPVGQGSKILETVFGSVLKR